jgi:Haem-binding domain
MLAPLNGMKKKLKWIAGAFVVVFALAQLANPARTNPPVVSDMLANNASLPHVAALLHAACYDCHSNETKWPWYAHVAPASLLVASDVNEGRRHLNLSEWPADDSIRAAKKLDRMSEEIDYREMPPGKYTLLHADARLTDADRKELTGWLDAQSKRLGTVIK